MAGCTQLTMAGMPSTACCLQVTEPVAGNYYPITAAAAITDGCMTLGIATDRWGLSVWLKA
jgi:hypothetical protein